MTSWPCWLLPTPKLVRPLTFRPYGICISAAVTRVVMMLAGNRCRRRAAVLAACLLAILTYCATASAECGMRERSTERVSIHPASWFVHSAQEPETNSPKTRRAWKPSLLESRNLVASFRKLPFLFTHIHCMRFAGESAQDESTRIMRRQAFPQRSRTRNCMLHGIRRAASETSGVLRSGFLPGTDRRFVHTRGG